MLRQIINDHIQQRQMNDTETRDNSKFRVSDAGKCRLMRYWKRQGKPGKQEWPLETLKAMQLGINIHEYIQKIVTDLPCGITRAICEQTVEDGQRIGHFDLYVELSDPVTSPVSGDLVHTILYDIKTKGSKQWFYFEKDGRKSDHAHEYQVLTYCSMIDNPDMPVDECRIAYVNRDTFEMRENIVDFGLEEKVSEDWILLIQAWERQEEPAPNAQKWECKYCMYCAECPHSKGYYIV